MKPDIKPEILKEIEAIPDEEARKYVGLPAADLIQEAYDLYAWAQDDRVKLERAGLDWKLVEDLQERADTCRSLTSVWNTKKNSQSDIEEQYNACLRESREVHKEIRVALRYAFRNSEGFAKRAKEFNGYRPVETLVQDLVTMAKLCTKKSTRLSAINFPEELTQKAESLAKNLRQLTSMKHAGVGDASGRYLLYKKSCFYLKQCINKIRMCGRYACAEEPERLVGYRSHYRYVHRTSGKKKDL